MKLRAISLLLFLSLGACAKGHSDPAAVTCQAYAGAFMEVYPDGMARKSDVAACSDGCNKVSDVSDSSNSFKQCSH